METAVCCIARNENRYIREFVDWNIGTLGFSKVVIYDNGVGDEESPAVVLDDYIANGRVEVVDWRNIRRLAQVLAYNDFLLKHSNEFDWTAFLDVDEFIGFGEATDFCRIDDYLSQPLFDNVDEIKLNWQIHGDNGHVVPDFSVPLQERFSEPVCWNNGWPIANKWCKCLVRGGSISKSMCFDDKYGLGPHGIFYGYVNCPYRIVNGSGDEVHITDDTMTVAIIENWDNTKCFIKHYMFKTITEYIDRKTTGWPGDMLVNDDGICANINGMFFAYNELTDEKADVVRKRLSGWTPPEVSFKNN